MRLREALWGLALVPLFAVAAWSGGGQGAQQQAPRPTLGPPTLNGPASATVTDPTRLLSVHTIYVDRMDNGLAARLGEELAASRRFRVVDKMRDADAVLRGTCFDSRRLRSLHSEVYLTDRVSGKSIWQDDVHQALYPPPLKEAVSHTANVIARHLIRSIVKAERP
jgi:hypothetical protein